MAPHIHELELENGFRCKCGWSPIDKPPASPVTPDSSAQTEKTDWLGAKTTDCICHRGKGWVCPMHGEVSGNLDANPESVKAE